MYSQQVFKLSVSVKSERWWSGAEENLKAITYDDVTMWSHSIKNKQVQ